MVFNIDSSIEMTDWLRATTWDLPTDPEAFIRMIGGVDKLDHFMTMPSAKAMPNDLKVALSGLDVTKHLAGKHDQSSHAGGKGGVSTALKSKPSSFNKLPKSKYNATNSVLMIYAGNEKSREINRSLHEGLPLQVRPMPDEVKPYMSPAKWQASEEQRIKRVQQMDLVIKQSPPLDENIELVRYTLGQELEEFLTSDPQTMQSLVGQIIENKGYTSTSTIYTKEGDTKRYVHNFGKKGFEETGLDKPEWHNRMKVKYKIVAPAGTKGVRGAPEENEFILGRSTKFMVTKVNAKEINAIGMLSGKPITVDGVRKKQIVFDIEMTIVGQGVS